MSKERLGASMDAVIAIVMTSLVSTFFNCAVVQGFYGVVVIATTVMMILIYRSFAKDDRAKAP